MALKPDQVEKHEFGSSLRGFDKQEVRSYLGRVSRTIRGLEEELAASQSAPVPAPVPVQQDLSSMSDEDRFGALGERIAGLLRNAHDSAAQIKAAAEAEIAEARAESDAELRMANAELEQIKAEAELTRSGAEDSAREIRATASADSESAATQAANEAIEIRANAESEGLAVVDARSKELDASEAQIQADREAAMGELTDARSQVSTLLEQARAQSEFIRLEADDIIREKIRSNIEAAESRLTVLRNTEEISRERIRLAQEELGSALSRLSSEPAPGLPEGTDQLVLDEAEARSLEAGYTVVNSGEETGPDDYAEVATEEPQAEATDLEQSSDYDDVIDVATSEVDEDPDLDLSDSKPSGDSAQAAADVIEIIDESNSDRSDGSSLISEAYPTEAAGVDVSGSEDLIDEEPVFGSSVNTGTDEVEVLKQASEANGEDALAKLVRDAMQSAVESARSGE